MGIDYEYFYNPGNPKYAVFYFEKLNPNLQFLFYNTLAEITTFCKAAHERIFNVKIYKIYRTVNITESMLSKELNDKYQNHPPEKE